MMASCGRSHASCLPLCWEANCLFIIQTCELYCLSSLTLGKEALFKDSFSFHRSIIINEYFNCQIWNYMSKDFRLGHIVQLPGMQMSRKTLMVTLGGRLTSPLQGTRGQEEESTQSNMSWTHRLRLDMPLVSWTALSSFSPRPLSPYKPPTALPLPVTPNPTLHQPPSTGPKLPQ